MRTRLEACVHGLVQGVFFRHYTRLKAKELVLSGTVANQSNGTVFVTAEGPTEDVNKLLEWLKQGPELARVDHVTAEWSESLGNETGFTIIR
jgi:acylphosphatase